MRLIATHQPSAQTSDRQSISYFRSVCAKCHGRNLVVMNRNGSLVVQDAKGRDRERYPIVYGARLKVKEGQAIEQGQVLVEWDPYTFSILTEEAGQVRFKDILEGITVH